MSQGNNLVGQVFGRLTVLAQDTSKPKGNGKYWICQCSCPAKTIKTIKGSNLTQKNRPVRSCGCLNKEKQAQNIDTTSLVGKVFGRLTVIERDLTKPRGHGQSSYWICECSCSNHTRISVSYSSLSCGYTQSCGCLRAEMITEKNTKDIAGQHFGYITPIERLKEKNNHGSWLWCCECSNCGNDNYICSTEDLLGGKVHSCGCNKSSYGERIINSLLLNNNICFAKEYSFCDLRSPIANALLRYDFAILGENNLVVRLIEFDGEQHFIAKEGFWGGQAGLEKRQEYDRIKNKYAKSHNIPLVRIPYTELDNISLDMIMGNDFLV